MMSHVDYKSAVVVSWIWKLQCKLMTMMPRGGGGGVEKKKYAVSVADDSYTIGFLRLTDNPNLHQQSFLPV